MNIIYTAKRGIAAAIIAVLGFTANAVDADVFGNDGIDRSDPNFVTASLLIMSPGNELYSCVGHSVLRLECPAFGLDYCFTYESESARDKVLSFLAGRLKMGMFAVPIAGHLKVCEAEGRGVVQYHLNLPPLAKQRLWKYLDHKVSEGVNLPYDYLKRGCAYAAFVSILGCLEPEYELVIDKWPERFGLWTRREFVDANVHAYPWNRFFIHTLAGSEGDAQVSKEKKVVLSADLLELLKTARVNGQYLISGEGVELLSPKVQPSRMSITPLAIAIGFVVLALINLFARGVLGKFICLVFLVFQLFAGAFFTYLVCISKLPATSWNWHIIPFNLLPLIFWKWRQKWAMAFVGLLVLWEIGMAVYPHRLTDPAYLVLVGAYILFYLKFTNLTKMFRKG